VLHEVPAPALADLQRELLDLASLNGKGKGEGRIDLVLPLAEKETLEPVLRWAFRAFPNVRLASSVSPAAAPLVVALPGEQPRLGPGYSGTEIAVLQRWQPSALPDFYSRLRWVLYREAKQPAKVSAVVLWMKRPELLTLPVDEGAPVGAPSGSGMVEQ
jgi:hypothetical protein